MKQFVWTMVAFATVILLLGIWIVRHEARSVPDCPEKVYIVKRPDGESLECVCDEGALATCFKPGP